MWILFCRKHASDPTRVTVPLGLDIQRTPPPPPHPPWDPYGFSGSYLVGRHVTDGMSGLQRLQLVQTPVQLLQGLDGQLLHGILYGWKRKMHLDAVLPGLGYLRPCPSFQPLRGKSPLSHFWRGRGLYNPEYEQLS